MLCRLFLKGLHSLILWQGIDLESLMQKNRFSFVDGLSDLFSSPSIPDARPKDIPVRTLNPPSAPTPRGPLPSRTAVDGRPADLRSPIRNNPPPASPVQSGVNTSNESAPRSRKGFWSLTSPSLPHAVTQITKAITSLTLSQKRVFLILDAPTVLLAATPTTSTELSSFILQLREQVHSTLLVLEADAPLLYAAAPDAFSFDHAGDMENRSRITPTPMEAEHAAFVSGQAHVARSVIGCRRLDTGAAKDVSGVLSVRRGGDWDDGEGIVEEMEVLYHVQTDGGVTVFQRGAGNAG